MMNMRSWKLLLHSVLVVLLVGGVGLRARADEDDDDEDNDTDSWQVVPQDSDDEAAARAEDDKQRAREERDRQREEARQKAAEAREEARQKAQEEREQAREEARQKADEARQRKEEAQQRKEEEKQRLEEEKDRAKEEKQRAKEELDRTKEERQRARDEQNCHDHQDECDGAGGGGGGGRGGGDKKSGRTTAKVTGPVRFSVEVVNADIQVSATSKDTVSLSAKGCAPDDLELDGSGDEFEADFSEWGSCEGPIVVLLPVGSSVELTTVQGNLKLKGQYKEVEASSVAGSIEVEAGDDVQAEAVQGKVKIGSARRVHVESVAGDVEFATTGTSPIVEVETVNGQVRWTGACAKGCRASIESFNGTPTLVLDPKASSFELRFTTQSGKFNDGLGTQASINNKNVKGYAPIRARFGSGDGTIRVETYQGGLELKKRP